MTVLLLPDASAIRDLRHLVLRAGLPASAARFDGDDEPAACHFAAVDDAGKAVGCATLLRRPWADDGAPAWQLRGMAVDDALRGSGVGAQLLRAAERHAARLGPAALWCNARTPASGFYAAHGWHAVGDVFDIPTAGPHVRMRKAAVASDAPYRVHFYGHLNGRFGAFSNFAPTPIKLHGKTWPTTEHFFQAQKFAGTPHEDAVRAARDPMRAAQLGRDRARPLRADWDEAKDDVMRAAVRAKFDQHPALAALLLSTGDAELVERTRNDAYWGDGGDGTGKNMLGRVLVEARVRLRG